MSNNLHAGFDLFTSSTTSIRFYPEPTRRICKTNLGSRHTCPDKDLVGPLVGVFIGLLALILCVACFVRHQKRRSTDTDASVPVIEVHEQPPAYTPSAPNSNMGQEQQSYIEVPRPANTYHSGA